MIPPQSCWDREGIGVQSAGCECSACLLPPAGNPAAHGCTPGDPTLCHLGNGSSDKLKLVGQTLQVFQNAAWSKMSMISFVAYTKESLLLQ